MILGNVVIGEGAIIQRGSVVTKDIQKYAIAEVIRLEYSNIGI